jgi:hypothetical protein
MISEIRDGLDFTPDVTLCSVRGSLNGDLQAAILARGVSRQNGRLYWDSGSSLQPVCHTAFSQLPRVSTMASTSQQSKGRDGALDSECGHRYSEPCEGCLWHPPAQAAFGSVSILLTMIRVSSLLFCGDGPSGSHLSRTPWPTNRITSSSG